ncbi:SusC/RagA family TonB-linked outer membrane protein [Bacteroides sp.]|uniref:SusC/RagA family TonB-linked outer membrane protein n=1 Tax=Bacteroides sp. TaxID=29523 RepID=UPI002FCB343B
MQIAKFRWLLILILLSTGISAQSQIKVTGVVTDASGEEMPGVNISIKGTTIGTITDLYGKFSINAPDKSSVLTASFIGYQKKEFKIGNQTSVKIVLEEDAMALDEVVISAGYTEVKRRDFTGAAGKANLTDMMKTPIASFDQALAGRIAGVQVSSNEGMPGSTFNIVVRGNNSLTQSNAPLYVIDGFPVEDANAAAINPSDIESLDILKDASATAIYGARGANGVVIITTKKGVAGKPTVTYNGSFSVQKITNKLDMLDPYEFVKLQTEVRTKAEMDKTYFSPIGEGDNQVIRNLDYYRHVPYYDWQDEIFRTALTNNHYASLTGGKDGTRYSTSLSYLNQEGVIMNSDFERYQGRMSLDQKISDRFSVNMNANYTRAITNGASPSSTVSSATSSLMYSVWGYRPITYDDTDLLNSLYDPAVDQANDYRFNPILSSREEYRKRIEDNLVANAFVEYKILNGLKAKVSAGYRLKNVLSESFNNSKTRYGNPSRSEGVNASMRTEESRSWLNENILTYVKTFKKKHNINMLAGITFQSDYSKYYRMDVQQITNEALGMSGMDEGTPTKVESALSESKLMSYLARVNYNYDAKYYLTASFRSDGSSKFLGNNRWGYFPSASAAWNFNREAFAESASGWLSNGKVRLSWGLTGNNRVSDFAAYAKLYSSVTTEYPFANSYYPGYALSSLPNADLKWETTAQTNLGLDLGFFNDRISLTVDVYNKVTRDLLLNADLPFTTGFSTAFKNIGKMQNRGLELTIETQNIKTKTFTWNTNFNISFNRGKILDLNAGQETLLSTVSFDNGYQTPSYIAQVGQPVGLMYGFVYEGTYKYEDFDKTASGDYILKANVPNNGGDRSSIKPGTAKYKDINGDGSVNDDDRTIIGRGHPLHTGGFTNNFTYKNFDLSVFFQWSYGNDIINANRLLFENGEPRKDTNMFATYADRWTPENPNSDTPAVRGQGPKVFSSRVIEDGSYIRLKTLSLGYNFPATLVKKWTLSSARVFVSGDNLLTFTSYSGYDPEVSVRNSALTPGFDYSAYPRAYNFSVGLNIGF